MVKYVFKDGPLTIKAAKDANPQAIGLALAAIIEVGGGELTPKAVVESARSDDSPLHGHFDWDDAAAAEKWRIEQARDIIRCIRVENVEGEAEPPRAFLSVHGDAGTSYRSVGEIMSSPDLQERLLAAAERDLESFTVRYRSLKEICAIVETAKTVAKAKRSKNETRVAA